MTRVVLVALLFLLVESPPGRAAEPLEAGAATIDISPRKLPAIRNGGFLQAIYDRVDDPLYARALVLRSGETSVVLCVVDSCMLPTDVCDAIKAEVAEQIALPADRILISATHTHSAPGAMALCLGTRKDETYTAQMISQVAEAIVDAHAALTPAKAGWAQVDAHAFTHCRRWIRRPDKLITDPFGQASVRAMMHPGYESPDVVGPSGPTDPELSVLSLVRADNDEPIAVMANYSMHYFGGGGGFSADYFGELAGAIEKSLGGDVIGIVSQGTSGDLHYMDYSRAKDSELTRSKYAAGLAEIAMQAREGITHRAELPLAMAEAKLPLGRRLPSPERLAWAATINAARGEAVPKSKEEVYAEQAEWIHANPKTKLVLQALRLGDLAITALPNEVYGITGLKLKGQSPLPATFNIELANGAEGYIPPPEQHPLGGYTTWPARTAGLEETAEPQIVESLLGLLETVSDKPRRPLADGDGPYRRAILTDRPVAYWPLDDLAGPEPREATGKTVARWEDGVALGLPGVPRKGGAISAEPEKSNPFTDADINRAAHVAGARLRTTLPELGDSYSAELWVWNGLPHDARPVTAYLFSRGIDGDKSALGEHLGIGGIHPDVPAGRLFFYTGNEVGQVIPGKSPLSFRDWHHVVLVRKKETLEVYLDGKKEIESEAEWTLPEDASEVFFAGRSDGMFGLEGKLDEVALYPVALGPEQVAAHFKAAERSAPKPKPDSEARSPEAGLEALQLPDGFEARIVAAEPLVLDPVAFDWDAKGRLWVVEMADYPLGLDNAGARGGRVRILEDRDGDGTYDHSTLFADGLNFPTGLVTWREGVIVTAAPDILYLEDTTGDGKADKSEVLYTGLTEGNEQLRANGLRWGLDNWIYVAAGGHHGKHGADTKLRSTRAGTETLVGSRDFRIRPDTGEVEAQSGPTQFGRNRDDWGRWFGTQNSHPLWHYVLPDHYLRRNPHFAAPEGRVQLPGGSNPPVFPVSPPEKRFHSFQQAGRYTSACGGTIYRDSHVFPEAPTMAFIAEPFHNLVQQLELKDDGATFSAQRVGNRKGDEKAPDFFTSEDRWCRPVMIRTGPDGALWIADMYRYMIEHPQWLPDEGKKELLPHYRLGDDMGRIYRVSRKGASPRPVPDLASLDAKSLVEQFHSPNGWVRDKAQQLLLWRGESPELIRSLRQVALDAPDPLARLHALCTLDGFGKLDDSPEALVAALRHPHSGLRENALRLAETVENPDIITSALELVGDPDAKVRLQLAFTLGQWEEPEAGEALADLLNRHGDDPFLAAAALSSALPHLRRLAEAASPASRSSLLPMALAAEDRESIARLVAPVFEFEGESADHAPAARWKEFGAFLDEVHNRKLTIEALRKDATSDSLSARLGQTDRLFLEATACLNDAAAPLTKRLAAAALLARKASSRETSLAFLSDRLASERNAREWPEILATFAATGSSSLPDHILESWSHLSPLQRDLALDTLMSRPAWTESLLGGIEAGILRPADFDATRRMRLLNHPDKATGKKAAEHFDLAASPGRADVVARYQPALDLTGDAAKGHLVYQRACAACHQLGGEGLAIGPGLETVADHPAEKILTNILDPNLDIQPGFHAYNATLENGGQLFGLLAAESASSLTFKTLDGKTQAVRRDEIASLQSTNLSLMPEGLEAAITVDEMADLIAYLRTK
ncbi:MAG: PVC-type heme-binding CxxCH protein [Verrucomicrobiales bacterium]